ATLERALALSTADACIVIGRHDASVNVRWAANTVTTNGSSQLTWLAVVSIIGRRAGIVTRTSFEPDEIETIVRQSEAACAGQPEAPDWMPLVEGGPTPAG